MKTLLHFKNNNNLKTTKQEKKRKTKKDENLNGSAASAKTTNAPKVKVVIDFMKKTTVYSVLQSRVRFVLVTDSVN